MSDETHTMGSIGSKGRMGWKGWKGRMVTKTRLTGFGAAAGILVVLLGVQLAAHHSFAAEFDDTKPVKVTGTITKVEWQNPHIWFYVDVKNSDGSVTNWAFSGGAPGQLMRRGITKDLLRIGAEVVVEGFRAKDASNNGFGQKVTFPDGRNVLTAPPPSQQ
jgi:hypothetical protein